MALVVKDRVFETSTTTGTGTLTLAGAVDNFQTFSSAIGNGNTTYYAIVDDSAKQWEVGVGTVGAGTLSRDTVFASSNSGSKVDFSANSKQVFCDYPASKSVYTDTNGNITGITGYISKPDYIDFDQTYVGGLSAGQLGWDGNNTLAVGMAGGNVVQHIGEDLFFYIKASSAITKGQLIMFTGAVGASGVLTGAPATGITDGSYIMGVAAEDMAHNAFGLVQCFGELTGINTNAFNEGDILYYNSAVTGGLTSTYPTSGPIVQIAAVAKKSAGGGVIYIRVSVTPRLTAGTGISVTQTATGTTITNTSPSSGGTVTSVTGTAPVVSSGGNTPAISMAKATGSVDGYLSATDWTTFNNKQPAGTYVTSVAATAPITSTGGTTPTLAMPAATSSVNGYLTSTDWTTFNNKGSGSVTSVGGTGTVSGISLSGTVTSSGNLTLGGALDLSAPPAIGGTTPNTGKFTTLESTGTGSFGTTNAQYIQAIGDATYPQVIAAGSGTNIPLVLQPKGTGALQAQKTDSSATGGNARGANAVDWQTSRNSAGQVASGAQSTIAGGLQNTASGAQSAIAGGQTNTSSGTNSYVGGGFTNIASGRYAGVLSGYGNTAAGFYNFIGMGYTNSGTSGSAVTTQSGTMNGTTSVTLSGSNANIKVGQIVQGTSITNFPDTYVAAISGTSLTLSQNASGSSTSTLSFFTPHGVVVGGGNNQATGSYSFIGGGGDAGTAGQRNTASGDWSVVCGGIKNTASGGASFVGGGGWNGSGIFSGNTASATGSAVVAGNANQAVSSYAFVAAGFNNYAAGRSTSVLSGEYGTTRNIAGNTVFAASQTPISGTLGVQQSALLILGRQTTDATATVLCSDANAAGTGNQVILPNNSAYYFKVEIIAGVTGGGNTSGWELKGVIKRGANAGTTAIVGSVTSTLVAQDAGASTWTVAAAADTSNGGLKITVTGQASTTIRWVARVVTTEMTY